MWAGLDFFNALGLVFPRCGIVSWSMSGCVLIFFRSLVHFFPAFRGIFLQKDSRLGQYFAFFSVNTEPNAILIEDY